MTSQAPLQVAEAASTHGDAVQAAREAAAEVRARIGANPDFALLFMTPHHREQASRVLSEVLRLLTPDALAGSTMSGVVGGGQEHLAGPGVSLFAARVPGARVQSFNLAFEEEASMVRGWPDLGEGTSAALLADPFSFPAEPFLRSLREKQRFPALFGGLSSGADRRGGNLLFRDDEMLRSGGVGLALSGAAAFEPVVSQGTSPVGPVFEVTRAERNVIYSLSGRNAFEELRELLMALPADERRRFGRAPHVGIRAIPNDSGESSSDYLVRGVVHMDPESGAIALSDVVGDGLSLQFQARDRESADLDLRESLAMASAFHPRAAGALMFPCTGRGVHLFQEADHDVAQVQRYWPDLPAAGAFAAGEIGPVCGRPYIHSLSASIGLLVPRVA